MSCKLCNKDSLDAKTQPCQLCCANIHNGIMFYIDESTLICEECHNKLKEVNIICGEIL